jgi:glyoxylase-like metal-dependent hydrolase (beta-lactamase superfamily II)
MLWHVHILTLGNHEFEGANNAYLVTANGTVTLIDTGIATPDIREELTAGLHDHGLGFADVDQIVLTHWHPDHTGLAGDIQAASGATVYVHEADAPLVQRNPDALESLHARQCEYFDEWGMPPAEQAALRPHLEDDDLVSRPPTVDPITDGETIDVGECDLRVLHAPGHAAGLCCFVFRGDSGREAFVGDAILPKYTPNVGGADIRVDAPLATYLETLDRLADHEFARIWPGHRDVIEAPTARAREIIDHHRERARRVLDILREEGPADAWTVSDRLFGDLEGIHILHGPGEAYAHLDHLDRHGFVTRTGDGYRVTAESPDLGAVI